MIDLTPLYNFFIRFAITIAIIIGTLIFLKILRFLMDRWIKRSSLKLKVDETNYKFLKNSISLIVFIIAFSIAIYNIPALKALSVSMLAGAGVLAVAIGFASQQAFSNIISGIFIVIFKPFKLGDQIKIGEHERGIVEDITLRHTVIRTFENRRLVIPNSVISSEKIENANLSEDKICRHIEFGISYDSDIDLAKKIMQEECQKHPNILDNRSDEEKEKNDDFVTVRVVAMNDFSVIVKAWAWSSNPTKGFILHCDVLESIKKRFDKEGVEIPFPYRTLVYKKDLPKNKKMSVSSSKKGSALSSSKNKSAIIKKSNKSNTPTEKKANAKKSTTKTNITKTLYQKKNTSLKSNSSSKQIKKPIKAVKIGRKR